MNFLYQSTLDILSFIYPKFCLSCDHEKAIDRQELCLTCLMDLPVNDHFKYLENEIHLKFLGRQKINYAAALFTMHIPGPAQKLIKQFKYQGNKSLGKWLGHLFAKQLLKHKINRKLDYIIPVPIHPSKRKIRGFNQTEIFARAVSEMTHIPVLTQVLKKVNHGDSQTKMNRAQRIQNTMRSFELNESYNLSGKHILLVDDVLTTGATLESCMIELQKIAEIKISIGIIAMTKS